MLDRFVPISFVRSHVADCAVAELMSGIEYRRSTDLLDEIPSAYKDIDEVIENARSLIDVRHTLRQFINVKGD